MARKAHSFADFSQAEYGSISAGGLILIIVFLAVGGIAVDVSNVYNQRTHLQVTADATAHAALYDRNYTLGATGESATASALALAEQNMSDAGYGDVVTEEDIQFGVWDDATGTFTENDDSRSAVRVQTHRSEEGENEIATYLLKFAGFDSWDVNTVSMFTTFGPPCLSEGFVAENEVDIQSNNSYFRGFCIHSNDVVSINSNNFFEEGTIVSMPDTANLELPNSGYNSNDGLAEALRYGAMYLRVINSLRTVSTSWNTGKADMWNFLQLGSREGQRDYITATARTVNIVNGKPAVSSSSSNTVEASKDLLDRNGGLALRANAVNYVYCSSPSTQLGIKQTISNLVIITNCQISFGTGGALENGLIATLHTGTSSISGSSGTRIGKMDSCAAGGGAQLVSLGGIRFASGVSIHGGQLIALKNIEFSANGDGLNGVSLISGDTVSGTSNMEMGLCGTGMEDNLAFNYFRMVM
ncbi:Domain of unknown function DUF2134, membrane [Paracoccaceae bacterium]